MHIKEESRERHTLSVMVDNEPGILARIAGLFTARGYNIESLTVSDVTADHAVSRITIVTSASAHVMEQILSQLDRLVPVHSVTDLTALGAHVERGWAGPFAKTAIIAFAIIGKTCTQFSPITPRQAEVILDRDRGVGAGLALDHDVFLGLDGLVETIGPAA
eukprot:gene13494-17925_t